MNKSQKMTVFSGRQKFVFVGGAGCAIATLKVLPHSLISTNFGETRICVARFAHLIKMIIVK